ncbi:carboxypeptidase-like regulatory domain-containing protein, partial [Alkalimonas sp.]|uniref:carboxypeptidase-like regulatory domain-containing protein n=1 Tax=Alkalimonas sp. TaxID=1872453 RepID=UPI00263B6AB1
MKIKHLAMAVALAMGASQFAIAETSSSMRGQILSPTGTAAPNTRIIIEHIPSGTRTETVTNASGNFVASGLRVGGPYRVIIDSDVHRDVELDNIFLSLGDPYRLNQQLEASDVERIAVTGTRINPTMYQAGSSSTWGEREIQTMPSFDRDLKDIVRQNPLATDLGDSNRS